MSKKKELGKGIRALITGIESSSEEVVESQDLSSINKSLMIPLRFIEKNPYQPRFDFDPEQLEELAKSIRIYGIIQPLTLRKLDDTSYQLISGERRYRAAKIAGLEEIPAYIREANDREMVEMALIENIHRTDLNAMEIAISYQRLIEEFDLTQDALSMRVGKERSTISNYVRLLKLPPIIQSSLRKNEISMGHARVLAGISDPIVQIAIFKKIVNLSLSVRATEKMLKSTETKKIRDFFKGSDKDPFIQNVEDELSDMFGTKVSLKTSEKGQSGEIQIKYKNHRQLNEILDQIKVN